MGGGQHSERPIVEGQIFRSFKMLNVKITKHELFDFLKKFHLFKLSEQWKYMIIFHLEKFWNFNSFPNCQTLKTCEFFKI